MPCTNDVTRSYTVPGPERQFAPTSTTKNVPLGVADARADVGNGGPDVAVLAEVVGSNVGVTLGLGAGELDCSVAANAVTVRAAASYGSTVGVWLDGRLHAVVLRSIRRMVRVKNLLTFTR